MLPLPFWVGRAPNSRGILRIRQVTLACSTHYVLSLNEIPVDDDDDLRVLLLLAKTMWAEPSVTIAA